MHTGVEDLGDSPTLTCQSSKSGFVCVIREAYIEENTGNPYSALAGTHPLCLWCLDGSQQLSRMTKPLVLLVTSSLVDPCGPSTLHKVTLF